MFDDIINWFSPLWEGLVSFFVPIGNFFGSVIDLVGNIGNFAWEVISFIGIGIGTGLSYVWSLINHLFALGFWGGLFTTFKDLSVFLGVDTIYLVMMFFVIFILIIFTFITRLIFGKLNFLNFGSNNKK